ncbi:3-oxoacyl-[acyl-carrier-protein] synthase II [Fodinibius salinus]|uniref:3-oxoacyl-[acyl-carrier-protein] synthase 2 n=1 Tax=Fodinibius salinus TaxID=860790 RepID=A0A5D3YJM3_9BACT|nr:beta-ketoacyl-ACP synthase II [Fodinibius salinus]TYP93705.1 3-oxoacyl-[acyl-carrier-protein] synthase II [Fodinibius salinus]
MSKPKRVVITGLGALSPIGNNVEVFWDNLINGVSGADRITNFDPSEFRTHFACELKNFDAGEHLEHNMIRRSDPFSQYGLIATDQAVEDSGIDFEDMDPFDAGVIWGSGQGGMFTFEEEVKNYAENDYSPRFNPFFVPKLIINMAPGLISMKYGLMGINYATVSACATSNTAIMDALNYIRWGKAKVMVTGGSEAGITESSFGGFSSMRAMSQRNDDPKHASRPFDKDRDGFVMGEGAAALILEEYEHAKARGAKIYGEVTGAAMTADAYHMTATHPEGKGATVAMQQALNDSELNAEDVDYLNTHATSTPVGDISETKAIENVFGDSADHLHISATKSMTGHLLGAAGAIEAIASIKAINENLIPPTINTKNIDGEIPESLNIVLGEAKEKKVDVAMSNTFGFGGHNGIVVFKSI